MPRASPDFINSLPIALPNTNEQKEVVDYLDSEITNINNTILKIKENIALLEEYKTSLIHHVVTGKIDVRGEEI
jgi:type I restriction enzyme S subunit